MAAHRQSTESYFNAVAAIALYGWLTNLSWSKSEAYVGSFLSTILSICFGFTCLLQIFGLIAEIMGIEAQQAGGNHRIAAHQFRAPQRTAPARPQTGGRRNQRIEALHTTVLDAFYKRQKGGAIVSYGDNNVIAIEFDGPLPNGGICGEMAYATRTRGAIEAGKRFLRDETYHHIRCNESEFNSLLSKYSNQARWTGNTDMMSGLKLYQVSISR